MYEKRLLLTLAIVGLVLGAFIYNRFEATNREAQIRTWETNTDLVKQDISFINAQILSDSSWFYWLFPSNTIQVHNEITFIQLAVSLHISSFYFETDTNWQSKFGFTVKGNSPYGFDDVNFIYKVDGTTL